MVDNIEMKVQAVAQLPPGAVPAFLGLILILAVLIEPWLIRRNAIGRLWARIRGLPLPPVPDVGGVAIVGAQTRGSVVTDRALYARGLGRFLARRDAAAIIIAVVLWLAGLYLRPDFWGGLDNSFNLVLAFTEVALLAIGLTFVIANGDIDLSVGSVLAMSGAIAAFSMKTMGFDPWTAILLALCGGMLAGAVNAFVTVRFGLPAFVATLGMFYTARGIAAWIVSGRELFGFPESFNLIGRKLIEALRYFGIAPRPGSFLFNLSAALSVQSIFMVAAGDHHRDRSRLYDLGPAGLCDRRQYPRRRLCRHQHRSRPGAQPRLLRPVRVVCRRHLHRLLPQLHPDRRPVPRTRRHRLGHHRRRIDLRRLRHHHRLACRCRGDHSPARPAFAAGHPRRRVIVRAVPALGERLHRSHPDPRRDRRHLAAPDRRRGDHPETPVRRAICCGGSALVPEETSSAAEPIIEMRNISKAFGAVRALADVDLRLYPGEVLGLVGDNSAGKSTLMKILTGAYHRDSGEILVAGNR